MARQEGLYYVALGGAGEIGMNLYLYGYGSQNDRRWIAVDCGIGFPEEAHAPGVEVMTPDISFLKREAGRLDALFITHAHEDHIGALEYLWPELNCPIYAGKFAAAIGRGKLAEARIDAKAIREMAPGERVTVGAFTVETFAMTHSAPETNALIIRTPVGTIFHSADFKIDRTPMPGQGAPIDEEALKRLGDEGILALACDSTNVFQEGWSRSESSLKDSLREIIAARKGRVAATSFASNVARVKMLAEAAIEAGRQVSVAGRAMRRMIEAALETGVIDSFPPVTSEERMRDLPDHEAFYLVTGSQGESRAALARIAEGQFSGVDLGDGDTVIFSSRIIPGNENGVYRIYNKLAEKGVEVVDVDRHHVHVSGHARRDEIARLYELLRPKLAIPMHGEFRHLLEHARMAGEWGADQAVLAPNGRLARLGPGAPKVLETVETGRMYVDGHQLIGAMDGVVRARRKMAMNGHIAVTLVVDKAGELIADPEARALGAPEESSSWRGSFEDQITAAVETAVEAMSAKARRSDGSLEEAAVLATRRVSAALWGKKPEVSVTVVRLDEN
ncbi:ribonuclease J [Neomegalonema perideroedes]|uniref:ribonuclease J n=1 Tax=Neomegalonema perideroedes TaxID=217219 RepID=UPI0003794EB4|nr:ribonuclease J [Neomegalonema perideroedes]